MKRGLKINYTVLLLALGSLSVPALARAESSLPYSMIPEESYEMDLDGDGKTETISYQTFENTSDPENSGATLEICKNGEVFWTYQAPCWSYSWELAGFPLADGSACLLAVNKADNDWNPQALVLSLTEEADTFTPLADLTDLTRQSDEYPDNLLSGWARIGYPFVLSTGENTFTIPWTESLRSTGNLEVLADYELSGSSVIQKSAPLRLDEQRIWTAWKSFPVYDQPESAKTVFQVDPDDTVHLTEYNLVNGTVYLKCVNEEGLEGWFPDPEELVYQPSADAENPEGIYQGYFKECVFAG